MRELTWGEKELPWGERADFFLEMKKEAAGVTPATAKALLVGGSALGLGATGFLANRPSNSHAGLSKSERATLGALKELRAGRSPAEQGKLERARERVLEAQLQAHGVAKNHQLFNTLLFTAAGVAAGMALRRPVLEALEAKGLLLKTIPKTAGPVSVAVKGGDLARRFGNWLQRLRTVGSTPGEKAMVSAKQRLQEDRILSLRAAKQRHTREALQMQEQLAAGISQRPSLGLPAEQRGPAMEAWRAKMKELTDRRNLMKQREASLLAGQQRPLPPPVHPPPAILGPPPVKNPSSAAPPAGEAPAILLGRRKVKRPKAPRAPKSTAQAPEPEQGALDWLRGPSQHIEEWTSGGKVPRWMPIAGGAGLLGAGALGNKALSGNSNDVSIIR